MRRHRRTLKYWTLFRLWWLGLRRPTRLALSGTLAAIVLGTAMPLTAAVGTDSDTGESGATTEPALAEDGGEPAETTETTEEPDQSESAGDQSDTGSQGTPADEAGETATSDTASEEDAESGGATEADDESSGDATGEPGASEATSSEDGHADAGPTDDNQADAEPSESPAGDDSAGGASGEEPSDAISPDEAPAEGTAPADAGEQPDETPSETQGGQPGGDAADSGDDQPQLEPAADSSEHAHSKHDDTLVDDVEIAAEEATEHHDHADHSDHAEPAQAPVIKDTATARKQAARAEKKEQEAKVAETGVRILTSWLRTYRVDANLPEPARVPQIARGFAKRLTAASEGYGADWALVLGAARALGNNGARPADADLLDLLARKLAGVEPGASVDELREHLTLVPADAAKALKLARYHRAAGVDGLVKGLDGARENLERRVLEHPEIVLMPEGRADIEAGRIGVRVLVTLLYLADRHDDVVVSSLKSGHRIFARPGVVSAHVYGQAVDIAALDGLSVLGNQGPGSPTAIAVRDLLELPQGVQPKQVISLHDMGGSSFADADHHHDHIHIGF